MSPSTTVQPRADSPPRWRALFSHDMIAITAAALLALLLTQWLVPRPAQVSLTVVNETDYELFVESSNAAREGWTPVLALDPGSTRPDRVTIDQGDDWAFRFTGQGYRSAELTMSRDELVAGDWTLAIPPSVVAQLESQGATPPPRSR